MALEATLRRRSGQAVRDMGASAGAILDALRQPLVVLDRNLRVRWFNRSFGRTFGQSLAEEQGQLFHELCDGQWDIVKLRMRLNQIVKRDTEITRMEIEHTFAGLGRRTLLVDARKIQSADKRPPQILLSIEDVTQQHRMQEQNAQDQQRLRALASKLVLAEARERQLLAADLHDGLAQTLTLAQMKMQQLRRSTGTTSPDQTMQDIGALLDEALHAAGSLTFELSPPGLHDLGFVAASHWLIEHLGERYGLEIEMKDDGLAKPMDERIRIILFRSLRELLINVAKHSGSSRATVAIHREEDMAHVTVKDEGVGMDVDRVRDGKDSEASTGGFGLFNILERLGELGGRMQIGSDRGKGTTVTMIVPIETTG